MHVTNTVVQAHYSCSFIKCSVTCFHLREASLRLAFDKKVECKEVKNTNSLLSVDSVVNKTTCFGLLGGHHQVQQETNVFHGIEWLDVEISSSTLI